DSAVTSYGAAPPRSAKPPLRPLAPPAISRASWTRTRTPARASVRAAEHPVTPAPTTTTSGGPSSGAARVGPRGSASQYDVGTGRCYWGTLFGVAPAAPG